MTLFRPHFLWAPNRAEQDPPNLKIWAHGSTEIHRETPDSILKVEHLLLNGSHILTGPKLRVSCIWSIKDPSRPENIDLDLFSSKNSGKTTYEQDFRIRAEFLVTFIFQDGEGKRKIVRLEVYKRDKCGNYKFHCIISRNAIWKSFREITVAGDTQYYGRPG